jgi:hypothetical protein
VAVTDSRSAQQALDTILEQGEGPRGDWRRAHFGQFVDILDEYLELREADPGFEPVRPVLAATVREHSATVPPISDPGTARVTDLFNVGYEILLQMFERYFAHTEESDAELATLADTTMAVMFQVIKPLGDLITTLPAGPAHPGMTAGPSFELFYESDYLMPHREAAWALLTERLTEAAEFADRIAHGAAEPAATAVGSVGSAFRDIAGSLAAHFPHWAGRGAAAPTDNSTAGAEQAVQLGELLARGRQFAAAIDAAAAAEANRDITVLFADAHRLLLAASTLPAAGGAGVAVDALAALPSRLVHSVLRPLAAALAPQTATSAAEPERSLAGSPDGSRPRDTGSRRRRAAVGAGPDGHPPARYRALRAIIGECSWRGYRRLAAPGLPPGAG